jgi:hypothetical protein
MPLYTWLPKDKSRDKRGLLTAYGLACGLSEIKEIPNKGRVRLYRDNNFYHVMTYYSNDYRAWLSFDTLKEARKAYNQEIELVKELP